MHAQLDVCEKGEVEVLGCPNKGCQQCLMLLRLLQLAFATCFVRE